MNRTVERFLYWIPRILGILISLFLIVLSTDVFGEEYGFWEALGGFLVHLIPAYLVIIALVVAWRWELIGGLLFLAIGLLAIIFFGRGSNFVPSLVLATPPMLTGLFFITHKYYTYQQLMGA